MLKIIKNKDHIIFNILGIKIKLHSRPKYNKQYINNILKQIKSDKKNYLYLDWPFGKYIFDSMINTQYKNINLIKFSLFDILDCKNRFELWDLMDKDKTCIEKVINSLKYKKINGFLVTLDWNGHHQRVIKAFKRIGIPTLCIIHEAVFQDEKLYYDSKKPISDLVLTWGEMTKTIFQKRGFNSEKIKIVGSIKLSNCKNYKPSISKEDFFIKLNLDNRKKTILYCCQLCDFQWGDQLFALEKQRNLIKDLISIAQDQGYNLIVRNAPAHPELILPTQFINEYKNIKNVVFNGLDFDKSYKSTYLSKPEEDMFFSDIVLGMNTTMQLEATILNKPALIVKYFDFNAKWNKELGLPICNDINELKEAITKYIDVKKNLVNSDLYDTFCKNYGYSNDESFNPLKEIEKILLGDIHV